MMINGSLATNWVDFLCKIGHRLLTHWGRVMHICVSKLTIIASDNGLSPGRRQAIIWTNGGILLIGPLGTNFSEISIEILIFSFKKMRFQVSSAKRRPFCLGLNVFSYKPVSSHILSGVARVHHNLGIGTFIISHTIMLSTAINHNWGWPKVSKWVMAINHNYCQVSNIRRTLVGN